MPDVDKDKLLKELQALKKRVAELEQAENAREVTERRLRESEERHRTLLDKNLDGVGLVRDGKIIYANPVLCEMMGCEREEVIGRSPREFTVPEDRERLDRRIVEVLAGGESFPSEYRLLRKDGTVLPVEGISRSIQYEGKPALLSVIRDIRARKDAEEARRRSEERYRVLYNDNPSMYFTVNDRGIVLSVNRYGAEQLGYEVDDLVGTDVLAIFFEDDKENVTNQLAHCVANPNEVHHWEFRKVCKDGSIMWVREAARAITGTDGEVLVLVVCEDITERKRVEDERRQLEAQVQHAQKLESLGVLAGGIAHDFNNLLVGILGTAGMTMADDSLGSSAKHNLQEIEKTAQRAADLCKQLLAYSGKGHFVIRPINLTEEVEDLAHLLQISVSNKAVLNFDLARSLPAVDADVTQIGQVVMNLVRNASEAIGDNIGAVRVATGVTTIDKDESSEDYQLAKLTPGEYVFLEVSDTGGGIDDATLPKIFDPFFSTKLAGRGFGLAAVLGIVRGHRGSIRVHSEPGRGTTFRVLLPRSTRPVGRPAPGTSHDDEWRGTGTVLVIDDEETVRSVAGRMLRNAGFDVLTAADGHEGVRSLEKHREDVRAVLLDVPIILSSGYDEQEATSRFGNEELGAFIQKPYRPQELLATIRQVLGD